MPYQSGDSIFDQLIPAILKWEGGYKLVNHPRDPGGKTKYGISERYNAEALHKIGAAIKDLTEDQAKEIYYEHYYLPSKAHTLDDSGLTLIHLDAAINHGVGAATEMLSKLFKDPRAFAGNGMNKGIFNEFSIQYISLRHERYLADPNKDVFLEGWMRRMDRLMRAHVQLFLNPEVPLNVQ